MTLFSILVWISRFSHIYDIIVCMLIVDQLFLIVMYVCLQQNVNSVEKALQKFVQPELLDIDNAYKCSR